MNRPIRIMRGLCNAPIAQLDRAPGYELGGREFESLWAHHIKQMPDNLFKLSGFFSPYYYLICFFRNAARGVLPVSLRAWQQYRAALASIPHPSFGEKSRAARDEFHVFDLFVHRLI